MYNVKSLDANEFIAHEEVVDTLEQAKKLVRDKAEIDRILAKAREYKGLTHREAAVLLEVDDEETLERMFKLAREVKEKIYGKRIVLFAPLYLSNYCVNNCKYCGYRCANQIARRQLTQEEVREEVRALEAMGPNGSCWRRGRTTKNAPSNISWSALRPFTTRSSKMAPSAG